MSRPSAVRQTMTGVATPAIKSKANTIKLGGVTPSQGDPHIAPRRPLRIARGPFFINETRGTMQRCPAVRLAL
jgi:hypothetical protein